MASESPRRRRLLRQVGIEIEVLPAEVDEVPVKGRNPEEETVRLAVGKAVFTGSKLPVGRWVLAADTLVVVGDTILGKPVDEQDAVRMIKMIAGKTHRVITGWCILKSPDEIVKKSFVESKVRIKNMDEDTVKAYVKTGEPMDKAGSYAVQGVGAFMVKSIEGSYTNVVGLPLCEVVEALEEVGAARMFENG